MIALSALLLILLLAIPFTIGLLCHRWRQRKLGSHPPQREHDLDEANYDYPLATGLANPPSQAPPLPLNPSHGPVYEDIVNVTTAGTDHTHSGPGDHTPTEYQFTQCPAYGPVYEDIVTTADTGHTHSVPGDHAPTEYQFTQCPAYEVGSAQV